MKLPAFTTAQRLRLAALSLYLADSILAYAQHVTTLPFVPSWLAYAWPLVLFLALAIHALAGFFGLSPADAALNAVAEQVSRTILTSGTLPPLPSTGAPAGLTPELRRIDALAAGAASLGTLSPTVVRTSITN